MTDEPKTMESPAGPNERNDQGPTAEQWHALADAFELFHRDEPELAIARLRLAARALLEAHQTETRPERVRRSDGPPPGDPMLWTEEQKAESVSRCNARIEAVLRSIQPETGNFATFESLNIASNVYVTACRYSKLSYEDALGGFQTVWKAHEDYDAMRAKVSDASVATATVTISSTAATKLEGGTP